MIIAWFITKRSFSFNSTNLNRNQRFDQEPPSRNPAFQRISLLQTYHVLSTNLPSTKNHHQIYSTGKVNFRTHLNQVAKTCGSLDGLRRFACTAKSKQFVGNLKNSAGTNLVDDNEYANQLAYFECTSVRRRRIRGALLVLSALSWESSRRTTNDCLFKIDYLDRFKRKCFELLIFCSTFERPIHLAA